jgi:hypothetical protein
MAIPVIVQTTSVLAYQKGEFFVFQPAATNTPTAWAATGLPAGLDIDPGTGRIDGAATEPGVYNVKLTASNGDGVSEPLFLAIGIESVDFTPDASIELNVNLQDGSVSVPGNATGAMVFAKRGDVLIFSIGFTKGGNLQTIPLALLNLGVKEFEPEQLLVVSDGLYTHVGSYDTSRYQIVVRLTDEIFNAILSSYEGDNDTYFDARAELRFAVLHIAPGEMEPEAMERSSQTFTIRLARDLVSAPLA